MDDKPPCTEEEVASRYAEYMSQANKLKELFDTGEFARHWTHMMRQTRGGITIETRHWQFDRDHKHSFTWTEGECAHTLETCMEIHGTVGETLFDTLLQCATSARVTIQSLHIYHCVRGRTRESFLWAFDGRLQDVDVRGLSFDPFRPRIVRHDRYYSDSVTVADEGEMMLAEVITTILAGIADKLRRLELFVTQLPYYEYHSHCTHWPPCGWNTVGLPLVTSIISPARSFSGGFRGVIREARNLKYLHLDVGLTKKAFNGGSSWRRFWRAIRHHPSRMVLDLRVRQGLLHLKHDTGGDSQSKPGGVLYSLEMYLSKRGPWDGRCEGFFARDEEPGYGDLGDTDDEEREYWEGKSDKKRWVK
jgi:hypothetical protein